MLSDFWIRLRSLLRRKTVEAELDDELRFHVDRQIAKHVQAGMPLEEAKRRARIELGGVEQTKEECRDARGVRLVETLWQDVRFGLRMLRKSPGFTVAAVLTLALGIGANTAIFSAVNGILIEPLPYSDSGRLVQIKGKGPRLGGFAAGGLSLREIRAIRDGCPALGQVAAYNLYAGATVLGGSVPDFVTTPQVSGNFFTMLGVRPLLGRPILPTDATPGNDHVAVLDYTMWKSDFGGDLGVIGKTIALWKKPYTVIGVMPSQFRMGLQTPGPRTRALWLPLLPPSGPSAARGNHGYAALARLRPGATLAAANSQLETLSARLAAAYPATDKGWRLSAETAKGALLGRELPRELLILLAAVGLVLLIACVNVSAMLLARSWTRRREVAIREALGATRQRVVWQFLVESLLMSLSGGALGLMLALWLVPLLRAIAPPHTARIDSLRLDANVLWFTLGVSILTGVFFGLAPALEASGGRLGAGLKEGISGLLEGFSARGPQRLRAGLVILEVAVAVVLAIGATLVARSLQKLLAVPLGYRTQHMLTVEPSLMGSACNWRHMELCQEAAGEILRRVKRIAGVESAAMGIDGPYYREYWALVEVATAQGPKDVSRQIGYSAVSPGYFEVMGMPLVAGRNFNAGDTKNSERVTIVSRAFARQYLGPGSPLGRRISMEKDKEGRPEWMVVVGEVGDVWDSAFKEAKGQFYLPATQSEQIGFAPIYFVRTGADPLVIAGAVKQRIWSVDKDAPIGSVATVAHTVSEFRAGPRFRTALLGSFGFLGALLAVVGIFGVISYSVSLRTREIGLRMALGARPSDALGMVIGEGMALAIIGIIIGIVGSLALTRLLRSFLFEIKPNDPATFVGVSLAMGVAALLACYVPARRAMRVDPMTALRHE